MPSRFTLHSSLFALPWKVNSATPLSGGCINDVFDVRLVDGRRLCVKFNSAAPAGMFAAEAAGLQEMAQPGVIRVPRVEHVDPDGRFLVLEYIEGGSKGPGFWEDFGRRLARLHRHTSTHFGFAADNWVGSTPQRNTPSKTWVEFFREHRLRYQVDLAASQGRLSAGEARQFEKLQARLPDLIGDDEPPALIHGDLWSGNYMVDETGAPVLIDPAAYYGHREAEFGITTLFGGYPGEFFAAYTAEWPLRAGWRERNAVYQLYHLLNHLNLFGGGYKGQCLEVLHRLS